MTSKLAEQNVYTELLTVVTIPLNTHYEIRSMTVLFLFSKYKLITWLSLNFSTNHPEQTTESQLNVYKDALHSIELLYVAYLWYNPFHS